jgi:hypothetical protein
MCPVVVAAVVEIVLVAGLSGGLEGAVKVPLDHSVRVFALDAEHDLDAVLGKNVGGPGPHTPRQNDGRPLPT